MKPHRSFKQRVMALFGRPDAAEWERIDEDEIVRRLVEPAEDQQELVAHDDLQLDDPGGSTDGIDSGLDNVDFDWSAD